MRRALAMCALLAAATPAGGSFGDEDAGAGAGSFLRLGAGARQAAMGETGAAFAEGAEAAYWNPALLGGDRKRHFLFSHSLHVESSAHSFAALHLPRPSGDGLGISVNHFTAGAIDQLDEAGATVGEFTPRDLSVAGGYGISVGRARLGASAKYVSSRIIQSASTFSFDVGFAASFFRDRTRIGAVGQNLSGSLKFNNRSEDLARTVRGGVAQVIGRRLLVSLEVVAGTGLAPAPAGGAELTLNGPAAATVKVRGGYSGALANNKEDLAGVTAGLGLGWGGFGLDYVWVPLGDLGHTHRVSLSLRIADPVKPSSASSTTDKPR